MSLIVKQLAAIPQLLQDKQVINQVRDNFLPYTVHLENEDKIGRRSMSDGREGYARLVSRIAIQHDATLAKTDNSQELVDRLLYNDGLDTLRIATIEFLEHITDTQFANSIDIMSLVDRYADSLENGRRNSSALDSAMKEIDEWNSRYGHSQETGSTPATPANPSNTNPIQ